MFKPMKNSGIVPAVWVSVLVLIVLLFIPFSGFFLPFTIWLGVFVVAILVFKVHVATIKIHLKPREIHISRGFIFLSNKKIQTKYITAFSIMQSPLQRVLKQCVIVIYTSGSVSVVCGVAIKDANELYAKLKNGGFGK